MGDQEKNEKTLHFSEFQPSEFADKQPGNDVTSVQYPQRGHKLTTGSKTANDGKCLKVFLILFAIIALASAVTVTVIFTTNRKPEPQKWNDVKEKWDALRVKWSMDLQNSYTLDNMPRTVEEAVRDNFTLNIFTCAASGSKPFLGSRYIKDGDTAVMLLYDRHGYIAGIQVGIRKGLSRSYPSSLIRPPWVDEGRIYTLTAYFVHPGSICSSGRTAAQFDAEGTGTVLYIQNGTDPVRHSIQMLNQESALASTPWTMGTCVRTMGIHYWYNTRVDMSCDELLPMFLLYNNGTLNAFGWAIMTDLQSDRYEHPPISPNVSANDPPLTCLAGLGRMSTMHVFLTSNPFKNNRC